MTEVGKEARENQIDTTDAVTCHLHEWNPM
jgi:hypothetical protein